MVRDLKLNGTITLKRYSEFTMAHLEAIRQGTKVVVGMRSRDIEAAKNHFRKVVPHPEMILVSHEREYANVQWFPSLEAMPLSEDSIDEHWFVKGTSVKR